MAACQKRPRFLVVVNCADIDECAVNNGGCSLNADCVNTNGSFNCSCKNNFYGDGHVCFGITIARISPPQGKLPPVNDRGKPYCAIIVANSSSSLTIDLDL